MTALDPQVICAAEQKIPVSAHYVPPFPPITVQYVSPTSYLRKNGFFTKESIFHILKEFIKCFEGNQIKCFRKTNLKVSEAERRQCLLEPEKLPTLIR